MNEETIDLVRQHCSYYGYDYEFDQLLNNFTVAQMAEVVDTLRTIEHKVNTKIYEVLLEKIDASN